MFAKAHWGWARRPSGSLRPASAIPATSRVVAEAGRRPPKRAAYYGALASSPSTASDSTPRAPQPRLPSGTSGLKRM